MRSRLLQPLRCGSRIGIVGIDEQSNQSNTGHGLQKDVQSLRDELVYEIAHACRVVSRPIKTCHHTGLNWILAHDEDNGCRRARRLCSRRGGQRSRGNQGNLAACEIGGQR